MTSLSLLAGRTVESLNFFLLAFSSNDAPAAMQVTSTDGNTNIVSDGAFVGDQANLKIQVIPGDDGTYLKLRQLQVNSVNP